MGIELRHLRAFDALGKELHFGRAADGLQLTQPALTKIIKQLEDEVGVPLLVRTTRRVELTEAGKVFLAETTSLATQIGRAVEWTRRAARGLRGDLLTIYQFYVIQRGGSGVAPA